MSFAQTKHLRKLPLQSAQPIAHTKVLLITVVVVIIKIRIFVDFIVLTKFARSANFHY